MLTNLVPAIEQHVDWIADCISHLRSRGLRCIEATKRAEDEWVDHVHQVVSFPLYVTQCIKVVARGFECFVLS